MAVYVDQSAHRLGRMLMCHMWADTEEELLAMADKIGVDRKWIQGHPDLSFGKHRDVRWIHFDIAKGKRALAVKFGAVETDKYGPVEFEARALIATGTPNLVAIGQERLVQVASCRARPGRSPF